MHWRTKQIVFFVVGTLGIVVAYVIFGLFLFAPTVEAQGLCPPGQPCPTCPTSIQSWRAATPIVAPVQRPAAMPTMRPQINVNPAIVRVVVDEGNCTGVGCRGCKSLGTGTIFDRREKQAAVVTAAHLFSDVTKVSKYYVLVRGKRYNANLRHLDKTWDVAVLAIWDPGVTPIVLADKAPTRGELGRLSGFGKGSYRQVTGRLTQFVAPDKNLPFEWAEYSVPVRDGDSGGPMLNVHGQLVGVISSFGPPVNPRMTVGCSLPRLRCILRAVLPPWPNRPGVIVPKPIVVMPPQPTLAPPPPPLPEPQPPASITTSILDYDKLAEAILARVGLADLQGPAGLKGDKGDKGDKGNAGVVDIDDLAERIKKRIEGSIRVKVQPINTE